MVWRSIGGRYRSRKGCSSVATPLYATAKEKAPAEASAFVTIWFWPDFHRVKTVFSRRYRQNPNRDP
jgi:hypothetical protein